MSKLEEAKKIKAEIEELKKKTKILEAKPAKKVKESACDALSRLLGSSNPQRRHLLGTSLCHPHASPSKERCLSAPIAFFDITTFTH